MVIVHKTNRNLNKVLIANRGEVARRIQATCRAQGLKTVALYTEQDRNSHALFEADEAYPLSLQGVAGYSALQEVVSIARLAHADALHPGYGFFAEDASAARMIKEAGIVWIGPSPDCMEQAGNKAYARLNANACGIPLVPGIEIQTNDPRAAEYIDAFCRDVGFPLIIKQVHGGGGKTIRKVSSPTDLRNLWSVITLQDPTNLVIEKCIENARHIEIQIAGDGKNFVHLYERECSVQRHHQKIIERSPALNLSFSIKERLYQAALVFAQQVKFDNIGTIEFLVEGENNFYFLEANPRLQVEHAVTELTLGIDLVALQIHLASGYELPSHLKKLTPRGHALECRIYAEDPSQHFAISVGTLALLHLPAGPFLRCDHDLQVGQEITDQFDPMIAKMTCWAETEQNTRMSMRAALTKTVIAGIETNITLLKAILESEIFAQHQWYTTALDDPLYRASMINQSVSSEQYTDQHVALIAILVEKACVVTSMKQATLLKQNFVWMNQRW